MATVAAIAAAKKHNREMEAHRRAAEQERARQWAEAECRRAQEQKAGKLVGELLDEYAAAERLRSLLAILGGPRADHPRTAALIGWTEERLANAEGRLSHGAIEQRLVEAGLFARDDANADE